MNKEYISPRGHSWEEVESQLFTPEERAAAKLRVAKMIELADARAEKGISIKKIKAIIAIAIMQYRDSRVHYD